MKTFQDKIVKSLPKLIIFAIAFYNFVWIVWQNKLHSGIACVICPWYITDSFPIESFLLLISAFLLFIPRIWGYSISVFISGYFAVLWTYWIVKWFCISDYSLFYRIKIITSQYFDHPLQIWEIQIFMAFIVLGAGTFYLINAKRTVNFD